MQIDEKKIKEEISKYRKELESAERTKERIVGAIYGLEQLISPKEDKKNVTKPDNK